MIEQHRITMITTAAGPYGVYLAGSTCTVDASLARALVLCGAARYLDGQPLEFATAPPATETADAPPRRRKP